MKTIKLKRSGIFYWFRSLFYDSLPGDTCNYRAQILGGLSALFVNPIMVVLFVITRLVFKNNLRGISLPFGLFIIFGIAGMVSASVVLSPEDGELWNITLYGFILTSALMQAIIYVIIGVFVGSVIGATEVVERCKEKSQHRPDGQFKITIKLFWNNLKDKVCNRIDWI